MKRCKGCGESKALEEFGVDKTVKDRHKACCKPCEATRTRVWRQSNKERYRETSKAWRDVNREKRLEANKRWREAHPEEIRGSVRRKHLQHKYGITPEEYDELLISQGYGCAVCRATSTGGGRRLHVDHCHQTGKVRGLLCHQCNTSIGLLGDDPERIISLAMYVETSLSRA